MIAYSRCVVIYFYSLLVQVIEPWRQYIFQYNNYNFSTYKYFESYIVRNRNFVRLFSSTWFCLQLAKSLLYFFRCCAQRSRWINVEDYGVNKCNNFTSYSHHFNFCCFLKFLDISWKYLDILMFRPIQLGYQSDLLCSYYQTTHTPLISILYR